VDKYELDKRVDQGLIYRKEHKTLPLLLYNYTPLCQYSGAWDEYTLASRGLVLHKDGAVVARPFSKFFNYGEKFAPDPLPKGPFRVYEKIDGSLGVVWFYDNKWHISTRGSFDNEYIDFAQPIIDSSFPQNWSTEFTFMVEICMPQSKDGMVRAVSHRPGLYLLGCIEAATGRDVELVPQHDDWDWDYLPRVYLFNSVDEIRNFQASKKDTEGWVVRWNDGTRIKIKTQWYLDVSRAIDKIDEKVRQGMLDNRPLKDILKGIPEELHSAATNTFRYIHYKASERLHELYNFHVRHLVSYGKDRKSYASAAVKTTSKEMFSHLMMMYDGNSPYHVIVEKMELDPTNIEKFNTIYVS
jgi:RNA ligase